MAVEYDLFSVMRVARSMRRVAMSILYNYAELIPSQLYTLHTLFCISFESFIPKSCDIFQLYPVPSHRLLRQVKLSNCWNVV